MSGTYFMDAIHSRYILTEKSVPAVWSDAAKNATLEAAKAAGISPVTLIKEPEAAALYTIQQLDAFLAPGDTIVVCDAGGGTVDLISYEIDKVSPTLELREIVPGTGDMVGSIALNRRFKTAVKELIPSDRWQKFKASRAMVRASQEFENHIKLDFSGDLKKEFYVDLPGAHLEDDPDKGLVGNEWKMTGSDVKAIFDPVITDILRLIQHQVQSVQCKGKDVRAIFLVGGFGGSEYLRKEVERVHVGIKVAQLDDAWDSIAKGAALSKIPGHAVVASVSAVRHYGVQCGYLFDEVIDKGQSTYVNSFTGETRASRMNWHINIGDNIKRDDKIRLQFQRQLPENFTAGDAVFIEILYDCVDKVAPVHKSKSQTIKENSLVSERAGSLSETDAYQDSGEIYWEVNYDLVIRFDSAVMTFSMELGGKTLGSVKARFEQ
ncbi:Hsp70 family chaperone [Beauveria brongniartii RCEF 3172]|uniref:Hsp70 family chaperone n=1 Tax=Beauveria brongniartii RCEF 3172 TaxID=1081107 RepID=A0A167BW26_9HYPO|nr:Hsp70 family chaperone [Beauveria brongniartii RCEF 3172]